MKALLLVLTLLSSNSFAGDLYEKVYRASQSLAKRNLRALDVSTYDIENSHRQGQTLYKVSKVTGNQKSSKRHTFNASVVIEGLKGTVLNDQGKVLKNTRFEVCIKVIDHKVNNQWPYECREVSSNDKGIFNIKKLSAVKKNSSTGLFIKEVKIEILNGGGFYRPLLRVDNKQSYNNNGKSIKLTIAGSNLTFIVPTNKVDNLLGDDFSRSNGDEIILDDLQEEDLGL